VGDLLVLGFLGPSRGAGRGPARRLEGPFRLGQDLLDPQMDLAGPDVQRVGQVADRCLAAEMPPRHLGFLHRRKTTPILSLAQVMVLRKG